MKKIIFSLSFIFILSSLLFAKESDWKILKSNHFIIHYKKAEPSFINRLKDYLEGYYQKITEQIGFTRYNDFWIWENRAKIYVYDNKDDYMLNTNQPSWSVACADSKEKIINTYQGVEKKDFFDKIVPHELAHIIFREFVGFRDNVPLWLDEGVASFFSEDTYSAEEKIKYLLKNNQYIALKDLPTKSLKSLNEDQVKIFYAESGIVIYYLLNRFGKSNFVGLCRSLKAGKSLNQALYANYPIANIDELNKRLINYLTNGK